MIRRAPNVVKASAAV